MDRANRRAQTETPAVVRDALLGQPITIGCVTIPVIMLGHVLMLQKVGSPLALDSDGDPTNEQVAEALYILNTPAPEALQKWGAGAGVWWPAVFAFAATVPLADLPQIGVAIAAQLAAAQSTVIGAKQDSPASSGEGAFAADEKKSVAAPVTSPSVAARPLDRTG